MDENGYVIGLDFGNCFTYTTTVEGMAENKSGGVEIPLLPPECNETGMPSRFYYDPSFSPEPVVGMQLIFHGLADAGVNLLKRRIGESFEMGGETFSCEDAIVAVVQAAVRTANDCLREKRGTTTSLVALAYPATYGQYEKQWLQDTVERATLADGVTHLQVVGTIIEPAAAALEYLSMFMQTEEPMTALVYDLGGGTFDVNILRAYPAGRVAEDGSVSYYTEIDNGGDPHIGGEDFSAVLRDIIRRHQEEAGVQPDDDDFSANEIKAETENVKIALSKVDSRVPIIPGGRGLLAPVTRREFEEATRHLLDRTVEIVVDMVERNQGGNRPEKIVLTGGASKMPMVKAALEEALARFGYGADDIVLFQPETAISAGAARFGVIESFVVVDGNAAPAPGKYTHRLQRDIGFRCYLRPDDPESEAIVTVLHAGAELPCLGTEFETLATYYPDQISSSIAVFEATEENPGRTNIESDWRYIGDIVVNHGRAVPKGFECYARLIVDSGNILRVEAYSEDGKDSTLVRKSLEWAIGRTNTVI